MVDILLKGKEKIDYIEIEVELLNYVFRMEDKKEQMGESTSSSEALFIRRRQGKDQVSRGYSKSRERYKSKGIFKSNEREKAKDSNKYPYLSHGLTNDQSAIYKRGKGFSRGKSSQA